jgi:membrane-bound serine protease (ClpP class)
LSLKLAVALSLLLSGVAFAAPPRVISIDFDGVMHPVTVEILAHAIDQAQRENAEMLLIRLNTPGGLLEATRQINEKIIASPVPVVTYVAPSGGRAASAGFFILLAGDVAAMAPSTNTGAASPVLLGQQMDQVMRKKVESDSAASLRSLAAKRGRNAELAEKAVLEAKSFTDKEALEQKLIDVIARDDRHLLEVLNGREITRFDGSKKTLKLAGAEIVAYEPTRREQIVKSISDPNIALVLLVLGALGIYIEFTSPGLIVPGVAGGILVLLGLSALSVLPISWLGAALLVLAVALFILEAKIASHGILGAGGAVAMILGALLLIDSPLPEMRVRLGTAIGITLPFAIITVFLLSLVLRARAAKVTTGSAGLVDEIGNTHTPLAPKGKVFIHGEFWDAVSSKPVDSGVEVRVVAVDGLLLKVEPK